MELLAEGLCEKLPDRGYRLVRRTRGDKKVILFGPVMEELGREMLIERPTIMPAILKAKNAGYHVLVAGFCNRHPLYMEADEFWGLIPARSNDPGFIRWYESEMKNRVGEFSHEHGVHKEHLHPGRGLNLLSESIMAFCPLPRSSPSAIATAKKIVDGKHYLTVCPRKVDDVPRQLNAWQEFIDAIRNDGRSKGLEIISTTPKTHSASLSGVKYLQDLVGLNDLLDVELALHANADCCVTTNTGAVGLMIFANAKTIVILGGTGGFAPGWNGMNDLVAKENGIKPSTLVLVPGNVCNCENQAQKKMAMDMADMTAKVLWPSG